MIKYYTRACNFYYGKQANILIKKRKALPLCGNRNIAFDSLEIYSRINEKVTTKTISLKQIRTLKKDLQNIIKYNLKKITSKRKNFLKNVNFSSPSIMGILNLTPDSFSDGGKFNKKKISFKHVSKMIRFGASIIDVGGESTRPGSKTVDEKNEWKRVRHVIRNFKKRYPKICLSLDTRKSFIMSKGIKNGVNLINDISGFSYDEKTLSRVNNKKISKVLHHMQGTPNTMQINPKYKNVLLDIYDFFEKNLNHSLTDEKVIVDPGIGFGKTLKHNLTLISKISLFHSLGLPILVGTSRKRFISEISGNYDSKNRIGGTLASVLFLLSQGVQIFRVHDVNEVKQGILVFEKLINEK